MFIFYPNCSSDEPCHTPVVVGLFLFALASSAVSILWSCVSYVVDDKINGTAYGIMYCV